MTKYRKKPIVIEAVQWNGGNIDEIVEFVDFSTLPNDDEHVDPGIGYTPAMGTIEIPTLEGIMTANARDWIIRGVKGEVYPCKPDIFDATYEAVE